jgi:hypothetical protein
MSTAEVTRLLLTGLIDYAGLFPPARLPMGEALADYRQAGRGRDSWLLGRFLCPASRLVELAAAIGHDDPVGVGVIVDTVLAGGDEPAVRGALTALPHQPAIVEIPAPAGALPAAVATVLAALTELPDVPAYVELPRAAATDWPRALDAIAYARRAGRPVGAKVRCGGLDATAFPSEPELARFVVACRAAAVPFKATAGLHHPVRNSDLATSFEMHGFLNLLLASALALRDGLDEAAVAALLEERDPEQLTAVLDKLDAETARRARAEMLVSYGSCSFSEPTDDLRALGVLPED